MHYITNFGSNEHVELFESIEEARKYNFNDSIHKADVNENLIYTNEDGVIIYEDSAELWVTEPTLVETFIV